MGILKWGIRGLWGLAILLAFGLAALGVWQLYSLPQIEGEMRLEGVGLPVDIIRSQHGIPIIKANTAADAYFALGFVHAQDRLLQMEIYRRTAAGQLAEVFGPDLLPTDRLMRSLDLYGLAQNDYQRMTIQNALDSYTRGINAFLDHHAGPLPVEFYMLGLHPRPWKPEDSLALGRLMGFFLSVNFDEELQILKLSEKLDDEQLADLYPAATPLDPVIVSSLGKAAAGLAQVWENISPHGASNAWAVSRRRSTSEGTFVASDPHLRLTTPSFWYLAKLRAPEFTLAGATFPGIPYVMIGHTKSIAWGMTTSYVDTQDLILADPSQEFEQRTATILVKGEDPVTLTLRTTPLGPVISDAMTDLPVSLAGQPVILQSAALTPSNNTSEAIQKMNWSNSLGEFLNAVSEFDAPAQNIIFGDVNNNIGLVSAGLVPQRATLSLHPATQMQGWQDYIPKNQMPMTLNPAEGILLNANNRVAPAGFVFEMAHHYPPVYRAQRIHDLLDQAPSLNQTAMRRIQIDTTSYMAREFMGILMPLLKDGQNHSEVRAKTLLQQWNLSMGNNEPAPAIFMYWMKILQERLLEDDLEDSYSQIKTLNPDFLRIALTSHPQWCDDVRTKIPETCRQMTIAAFQEAVQQLINLYGIEPDDWRWGDLQPARFTHTLYSKLPVLTDLLTPVATSSGSPYSISRSEYDFGNSLPFTQIHGAGLRVVFDLNNLENSEFVIAPGQSANIFSRNYRDMVPLWQSGDYITLNEQTGKFRELSRGKLTLRP